MQNRSLKTKNSFTTLASPMSNRERILDETYKMMSKIGPQSMTMDTVAHNCGVSKRTLYEQFGGKANLIKETLLHANNKRMNRVHALYESASNSFEALMLVFLELREMFSDMSDVVLFDIKRLYPELLKDFRELQLRRVDGLTKMIDQAKEEGLALPSLNSRQASYMLFVGLSNMRDTLTQGEWEFDPREMFEMIFLCFIRGIATEKGRHFVDNFLLENFNDIKDKKIN